MRPGFGPASTHLAFGKRSALCNLVGDQQSIELAVDCAVQRVAEHGLHPCGYPCDQAIGCGGDAFDAGMRGLDAMMQS